MSWRLVDGVAVPDAVAGSPALDFCNTRAGWGSDRPKEYLISVQALAIWAGEAGLLSPRLAASAAARTDPEAQRVLHRALALREAVYPVALGRGSADDWATVSAEAARGRAWQQLAPVGPRTQPGTDPRPAARWRFPAETGTGPSTEYAIAAIAVAVADLLVSTLAGSVSACPGQGCGWLFADPRGRRRWCSMAVCGNRAKARRFAVRHA